MEQSIPRRVGFAQTAGTAEAAKISVANLSIDVAVRLKAEDFAEELVDELDEIAERIGEIYGDLHSLAHATDPDVGWDLEHRRLGHGGNRQALRDVNAHIGAEPGNATERCIREVVDKALGIKREEAAAA